MRILIVEDDCWRVRAFREWFTGCDLTVASNPIDAIATLNTVDRFDGIMLDYDLLSESGYRNGGEVVDWMIKHGYYRSVPCLIHSMNPLGRLYMWRELVKAGFDASVLPYTSMTREVAHTWTEIIMAKRRLRKTRSQSSETTLIHTSA